MCHLINDTNEHIVFACDVTNIEDIHLNCIAKLKIAFLWDTRWRRSIWSLGTNARVAFESIHCIKDLLILDAIHSQHLFEICSMRVSKVPMESNHCGANFRRNLDALLEGKTMQARLSTQPVLMDHPQLAGCFDHHRLLQHIQRRKCQVEQAWQNVLWDALSAPNLHGQLQNFHLQIAMPSRDECEERGLETA